jgi:hypothetical protein
LEETNVAWLAKLVSAAGRTNHRPEALLGTIVKATDGLQDSPSSFKGHVNLCLESSSRYEPLQFAA